MTDGTIQVFEKGGRRHGERLAKARFGEMVGRYEVVARSGYRLRSRRLCIDLRRSQDLIERRARVQGARRSSFCPAAWFDSNHPGGVAHRLIRHHAHRSFGDADSLRWNSACTGLLSTHSRVESCDTLRSAVSVDRIRATSAVSLPAQLSDHSCIFFQ